MIEGKESWLPLSRGLDEHLPYLSGNAVKVFLHILINAHWFGDSKGKYTASINQIATELKMGYMATYNAVRELNPEHVIFEPGKNQYSSSVFTIMNYKTIKDFATSPKKKANEKPTGGAVTPDFQPEKTKPLERPVEKASKLHNNHNNVKEGDSPAEKSVEELLLEYSRPELINKYLQFTLTPIQRKKGVQPPDFWKQIVLNELRDDIARRKINGKSISEAEVYLGIERLFESDKRIPVNIALASPGQCNKRLLKEIQSIYGQSTPKKPKTSTRVPPNNLSDRQLKDWYVMDLSRRRYEEQNS